MIDYTQFAFIFDMDGTLVDNMRFHGQAWQQMLLENGVVEDAHEFLVKTAGKTNREIIPAFFPEADEEKLLALVLRKETLYRELFLPHRKVVAGAVEFLNAAKDLGIRMAVATAAPVENMKFILDGLDLRKFFDAVTTAEDVSHGKPHPEVFLKSAKKLGVDPKNSIVFEDALNGFDAASRAGAKSVAVTTVHKKDALKDIAGLVEIIDDFESISPEALISKHLAFEAAINI